MWYLQILTVANSKHICKKYRTMKILLIFRCFHDFLFTESEGFNEKVES